MTSEEMLQNQIFIEESNAGVWWRKKVLEMDTQMTMHIQLPPTNLLVSPLKWHLARGFWNQR